MNKSKNKMITLKLILEGIIIILMPLIFLFFLYTYNTQLWIYFQVFCFMFCVFISFYFFDLHNQN